MQQQQPPRQRCTCAPWQATQSQGLGCAPTGLRSAVLDLGDVLHHILEHLSGQTGGPSRKALRSTCRRLRASTAIQDSVHSVAGRRVTPELVNLRFLASLRHLHSVRLDTPDSLFYLHHLPQLRVLEVADSSWLDLTPLASLPQLVGLRLGGDRASQNLQRLTRLTTLALAAQQPGLRHLTALRRLELTYQADSQTVAPLQQLSCLDISTEGLISTSASPLIHTARRLPALCLLGITVRAFEHMVPPASFDVLSGLRITALRADLFEEAAVVPDDMLNFDSLPSLQSLSVRADVRGAPTIVSRSVTCLHLEWATEEAPSSIPLMPSIAGCSALQCLFLELDSPLALTADKMPPQPISVSVSTTGHDVCVGRGLQVQFVDAATWPQDPSPPLGYWLDHAHKQL